MVFNRGILGILFFNALFPSFTFKTGIGPPKSGVPFACAVKTIYLSLQKRGLAASTECAKVLCAVWYVAPQAIGLLFIEIIILFVEIIIFSGHYSSFNKRGK